LGVSKKKFSPKLLWIGFKWCEFIALYPKISKIRDRLKDVFKPEVDCGEFCGTG